MRPREREFDAPPDPTLRGVATMIDAALRPIACPFSDTRATRGAAGGPAARFGQTRIGLKRE